MALNSPGGKSWSDLENLSRGTKLLGRMASIWGFQRETGKYIHRPQTWGALQTTSVFETYFQNRRCHELQTSRLKTSSPEPCSKVKCREGKCFVWLTWKTQARENWAGKRVLWGLLENKGTSQQWWPCHASKCTLSKAKGEFPFLRVINQARLRIEYFDTKE